MLYFWGFSWVMASMVCALAWGVVPSDFTPSQIMMALAVLGAVAGGFFRFGWRLPGIRRLYPSPPPRAVVTPTELELRIPAVGVRVYRWEEIGDLAPGPRGTGLLRSPEGQELVSIPADLLRGNRRSLAKTVVRARCDRYVAVRKWRFGHRLYFASRPTPEQTSG
ncbi:MAG TPA: hypothetical protein VF375_05660 [Candidatus Limnocylindrales bacterium]